MTNQGKLLTKLNPTVSQGFKSLPWLDNRHLCLKIIKYQNICTVKLVCNDQPWDLKIVAVVERWSLFKGHLCSKIIIWDLKMVAIVDKWSLFGGGRQLRFDCISKYCMKKYLVCNGSKHNNNTVPCNIGFNNKESMNGRLTRSFINGFWKILHFISSSSDIPNEKKMKVHLANILQ